MKKETIIIKFDYSKEARGHQSHISGTGPHKDKRMKGNRSEQVRRAIQEF